MTSRFWGRSAESEEDDDDSTDEEDSEDSSEDDDSGSDDSEDESETESDSDDSSDRGSASRFLGDSDSDESREEERRVVRSARERRFAELQATCEELKKKMNINDWINIATLFDKLNKQLEKSQKLSESTVVPTLYIRMLVKLEDFYAEIVANKDAKKKMSPTNARAFNSMRQKLKKNNRDYEEQIDKFREKPIMTDDELEEEEEEEEDEKKEIDEVEQEDVDEGPEWEKRSRAARAFEREFVKKHPSKVSAEAVEQKVRDIMRSRGRKGIDRVEQVRQLRILARLAKTPAQALAITVQVVSAQFDLTPSMAAHMAVPIWKDAVRQVHKVIGVLKTFPKLRLRDLAEGAAATSLAIDKTATADVAAEAAGEETARTDEDGRTVVWGNIVAFLERLDDELFKSWQCIDPHTTEYIERLRDELLFLRLAQDVQGHCESERERVLLEKKEYPESDERALARVALRRMEHVYCKTDTVYRAMANMEKSIWEAEREAEKEENKENTPDRTEEEENGVAPYVPILDQVQVEFVPICNDLAKIMNDLKRVVYAHGDERTKARAILCDIYYKSVHDKFFEARDLLLMSHLQDTVNHMDIATQILYNRAIAQLGLCAFRCGAISEAQQCLSELYSSGRVKELLAQGLTSSRYYDKNPEQEKLERRRQMPFHMHINLELLETVHLLTSMLMEVPNIAASNSAVAPAPLDGAQARARIISRPFRRLLDNYEKQPFVGPPENVRDHVMAATREISQGRWREAFEIIVSLSSWRMIPDGQREPVLEMVNLKMREQGLRTFLFSFGGNYTTLSVANLAEMFELPPDVVHALVSKMMLVEYLSASWDQPSQCIVFHNRAPTSLQLLGLNLSDKVSSLLEINERNFELRIGGAAAAAAAFAADEEDDDFDNKKRDRRNRRGQYGDLPHSFWGQSTRRGRGRGRGRNRSYRTGGGRGRDNRPPRPASGMFDRWDRTSIYSGFGNQNRSY